MAGKEQDEIKYVVSTPAIAYEKLHTAIVTAIPEFVAKVQRNKKRQVIITTHSYEILSNNGIRAEELVILRPSPEGTVAENANDDKAVSAMLEAGLSAADAAMSEMTALLPFIRTSWNIEEARKNSYSLDGMIKRIQTLC